jgi:predicted PurR-regulated permease PerM
VTDARRLWLLGWLLTAGWVLYLLSPILMPFVISALFAYLGDPLVDRLERYRIRRTPAVALVFLALFIGLMLLLLLLVPRIEAQISQLLQKLPGYVAWLRSFVLPRLAGLLPIEQGMLDMDVIQQALLKHWRDAGGLISGVWSSVSGSGLALFAWLANVFLVPVLTFYLLRDWDRIVAGIRTLFPRRSEATWVRLAGEADEALGGFLRGQLAVMFALGAIYTTGLWLVGLDFALLIGMFAGLVSFVPYLGLIVGILVAGLASILQAQGLTDLPWVVAVFVIAQLIEGSFLTPRLVGDRIGLHPVAVIFAILAGGQLYGFFGILLALPVAAVGMVLLRHLLQRYQASELYGPGGGVPPDEPDPPT